MASVKLRYSVGKGGKNKALDIALAQRLLKNYFSEQKKKTAKDKSSKGNSDKAVNKFHNLAVNGQSSTLFNDAIVEFQKTVMGKKNPDGRIDAGGTTFNKLIKLQAKKPTSLKSFIFGSDATKYSIKMSAMKTSVFKKFFKHYYGLTTTKGEDLKGFIDRLKKDSEIKDVRWAAYMIATAYIETQFSFKPVREVGKGKGKSYSKEVEVTDTNGIRGTKGKKYKNVYYGRGYVQLTHDYNYKSVGKALGYEDKLYIDPDLALGEDIAYKVASYGMRHGTFTTHKLSKYFNSKKTDYVRARYIINGKDRRDKIARIGIKAEMLLRLAVKAESAKGV